MTSRDRKFVGVARKWHHAVCMLFTFFWSLHEVSSSKMNLDNAFFCKIHVCDPFVTFTVTAGHRSWCEMKGYI